jgi:WD40 repeat protein
MTTETRLHRLSGHRDNVTRLGIAASRRRVVSGSWDGTTRIWDLDSGVCLHILKTGRAGAVALSPDERYLVANSADGVPSVWDISSPPPAATPGCGHCPGCPAAQPTRVTMVRW